MVLYVEAGSRSYNSARRTQIGRRPLPVSFVASILLIMVSVGAFAAAPTCDTIVPTTASPTNSATVSFTVTFSEAAQNFNGAADLVITEIGVEHTGVSITLGPTTYTVDVTGVSGNGTITLAVATGSDVQDVATSNALTSSVTSASVSIDTTPANAPSVTGVADDKGSSSTDEITNDNTLIISGMAEANSTVEVFRNSYSIGTTPADGSGDWTFDDTGTALVDGTYAFTAEATDAAGNTSPKSSPLSVVIDTQLPPTPGASGRTPADSAYTNDDRPIFEWEAVTDLPDPSGSGVRDYHIQIFGSGSVKVKDSYPNDLDYQPGAGFELADDVYTWWLATRDVAGNTGPWGTIWRLVVDTDVPGVGSVTPNLSTIAEANIGDKAFTLTIDYDEAMNTGIAPTVSFPTENPLSTLTFDSGSWSDSDTYVAHYDVASGTDDEIDDIDVRIIGAQDLAGNTQTQYDKIEVFSIDMKQPIATGVTPLQLTEADAPTPPGSGTVFVAITFDEGMDTGTNPNPTITGLTSAYTISGSAWSNGDKTWTGTFTYNDDDEQAVGGGGKEGTYDVSGFKDVTGNTMVADASNTVDVDTEKPTVTLLTENLSMIAKANVGDKRFTLTIDYDEPMDTSVAPTASLPVENPALTLTLDTELVGGSGWIDSDTYVARYDVADANQEIDLIDVRVVGGKDVAGNMQVQYDEADVFSINTVNPEAPPVVGTLTIDTNPVYEGDLIQLVTVTFDEAMRDDGTANPVISFGHGTWTSNADGAYDVPTDTIWTETFTLTDNDEEYYDRTPSTDVVTVDVTGAKDEAGNDQENYVSQTEFDIDTLQPTIADATSTTADGCYRVLTGTAINVSLTFSEDVVLTSNYLELVLVSDGLRTYHVEIGLWATLTDAASGTYTVAAGENSCGLTLLSYSTTGIGTLLDWAGNVIDFVLPATGSNIADHKAIVVDTTIPVTVEDPNDNEDRSGSADSDFMDVRLDTYGQYRLTVRENTSAYVDVKFNDSDLPCAVRLLIYDIPQPPHNGLAWFDDPAGNIRYAPNDGYIGPDEFTYRIYDACGNISQEATVYLEVVQQTVMDDIYLTTCADTAISFDVTATDLWIDPDNPGAIPFVFSILTSPMHGVISGDLGAVIYARAPGGIGSATITLIYTPAAGFVERDALTVQIADPFGGSSSAAVDIAVIECVGPPRAPPLFALQQGAVFSLIVPLTFASVYETAWDTVMLIAETDGAAYQGTLSAIWDASIGRYILILETASLPPGQYQMTIPLGSGESVTLMIDVGEAT